MSRVFVATEVALGRRVAVKVLSAELLQGAPAERFAREIALAAQLQDPHIVPVHSAGTTGEGLPYFTMPFVEGESLRARLQRGPVPLDEALRILRDVAEALEYAHAQGVVHRDIKPENVLLTTDGSPLLTDFGIGRALDDARRLTSHGMVLGTPEYMSPEQAQGNPVDKRTDLYSLGIMTFHILTGRVPFSAPQGMEVAIMQVNAQPPDPRTLVKDLPEPGSLAILRMLSKKPVDRFGSAAEFVWALTGKAAAGAAPPPVKQPPEPKPTAAPPQPPTPQPAPASPPTVAQPAPAQRSSSPGVAPAGPPPAGGAESGGLSPVLLAAIVAAAMIGLGGLLMILGALVQ
jgi:serine/threonine-protein kinase